MSLYEFDLTITQEDLDKAIEEVKITSCYSRHCVVAQALKRKFPTSRVSCAVRYANVDGKSYKLSQNAFDIVCAFDDHEYENIPIPSKITLVEEIIE